VLKLAREKVGGLIVASRSAAQLDKKCSGNCRKYSIDLGGVGNDTLRLRMPYSRTLVVDDFDDFRRFLCSTLKQGTECEVVGEASDGLQAVNQAEKLQPDLILLDLGLPILNGIQAARRIRQLSPNSKILFISQNSSPEIAQGALKVGAHGYLVKSDTTELTSAISAVLAGAQFISSRLKQP
jgi:DNA-binding NarL/FixJ family response regulator